MRERHRSMREALDSLENASVVLEPLIRVDE